MSFGKTIRRRRKALGFTLEQVAERAKLTPNYVGSLERDERDPSLSTVGSLAKALDTSPAELLGGVKGLGADGVEIGLLAERLPSEQRAALTLLLRSMLKRR